MNKKDIFAYTKTIGAYFSASLIPMILNLLFNPLIALNMTPEDFAITGYFTSFSTLLTPLVNFYFLHYYSKRFYECDEMERHKLKVAVFKLLVIYSIVSSFICLFLVWCYIKTFNSEIQFPLFPYLPLAILAIPLSGIYNLELVDYKMAKKSKNYFNLSVASGVINAIAVLVLVVVLKMSAFGKMLAPFLINFSIFLYLIVKHHDLWKVKIEKSFVLDMFKFCWPLTTAAMLGYFTNGFDKTYLESVGDVTEYGYYCVASSMAAYLHVFSTAIYNTFTPDVYEAIAKHNNKKLIKTFGLQQLMNGSIVIVFVIFCPIVIFLLTAGRYMESTMYTRIMSVATLTQTFYFNINCFTIAKGYPKLSMLTSIIGSVLIILFMWLFVRKWTYIGGAWMVSLSYIILFVVNVALLVVVAGRYKSVNFIRNILN